MTNQKVWTCKCEHWQTCPVCYPIGFKDGIRLPPPLTELEIARTELEIATDRIEALESACRMAIEMIETNAHERRHVRWALKDALKEES